VDDKVNKVLIFTMEIYSMGASYVKDSFLREQSDCSLDSGCLFGARFILASALMITCLMIVPGSARSESITIGGTGAGVGTMRILAQEFQKTYPGDTIKVLDSIGSGGGIRAVLKGAVAFSFASRPIKAKEKKKNPNIRSYTYGATPLALVSDKKRDAKGFTHAEVVSAFTRTRKKWADGTSIRIILREHRDSEMRILRAEFAEIGSAIDALRKDPGVPAATSDQVAADMAEKVPGSLTTSTVALIASEKRRLHLIPIDGVSPSAANLANGSYKMQRVMRIVYIQPLKGLAEKFVNFIKSDRGRKTLMELGHNIPK
jgi:phosphate transport system substrate-binding protein